MRPTFDIVTDSPGAQPEWIESAEDLDDAKERLRKWLTSLRAEIASFILTTAASWKSFSAQISRCSEENTR